MRRALFDGYGPLSTFSGCIGIGYAFSVLDKWQYAELNSIRHIRNHFAHHPYEARFMDPDLEKHPARLTSYDPFLLPGEPVNVRTARIKYLEACGMVCVKLYSSNE